MSAHLNCPECDAEVFPTDDVACSVCGKGTDDHDETAHGYGEQCDMAPTWYDDERCACPECGIALRTSADGERAWVEVAA